MKIKSDLQNTKHCFESKESKDLIKRRQGRPLLGTSPMSKRIIFRLTEDEFLELNAMHNPESGTQLKPNILARDFFIRGLRLIRGLNKASDSPNQSEINANAINKGKNNE